MSSRAIWPLLAALAVCAGCKPDLIVRRVDVSWDANDKQASALVANGGTRRAGPFLVYFDGEESPASANHRPQVTREVPGLAAGASVTLQADFAPLAHPDNASLANVFQIAVTADPKNAVAESNETNNRMVKVLGPPRPDLIVVDIVQDGPFYLVTTYKNVGGPGTGDFLIKLSANGQSFGGNPLYRFPVPPPGVETKTGGLTIGLIGLQQGSVAAVTAEIDWEQRVAESNEGNNTFTKTIQIQ